MRTGGNFRPLFLKGMRSLLILLAVPNPAWGTLMYPLCLLVLDWGFALYIVVRRAQLGYPLHEYAKEKQER